MDYFTIQPIAWTFIDHQYFALQGHVTAFDSFDGGIVIYSDDILKSLKCLQKA